MTVEVSFRVDDLPMVLSETVGGGRLVLLSARALARPWRLS